MLLCAPSVTVPDALSVAPAPSSPRLPLARLIVLALRLLATITAPAA